MIWTALLHSLPAYNYFALKVSTYIIIPSVADQLLISFAIISIARVITYLLYPVAGLLAELYWSRYKVMIVGNVIAVVGASIVVPAGTYLLIAILDLEPQYITALIVASSVGIILLQFGMGLFEANAIQFGVDQLQFAPNNDISKFVNWYYWALTVLQLLPTGLFYLSIITGTTVLLGILCSLFYLCCKRYYVREPVRHINPVKHIARVLQYARQHTVPVFRSAFTYGEGPPSRLDLAKDRYGGPYTTEEVEDVKSFGRIVLVLLSQFGVLLVNRTSLFYIYLYRFCFQHCYEFISFSIFDGGNVIWYSISLIMIPVYMIIIRPYFQRYIPSMLKRMGISLLLVIIALSLLLPTDMILHNAATTTNETFDFDAKIMVISFGVMAEVTSALAYVLNFLTALEFILAQAPRNMQGLLIGIWYAYQAMGVLVQLGTIVTFRYAHYSYLPSTIRLPLAVISFIMYVIVSRWYRYRKRNELSDINERTIIEEYTERQLLQQPIDDNYTLIIEES